MTLVFALGVGVLFGTGAYLLLSRDLVRVVFGVAVISHASVLTLNEVLTTHAEAISVSTDAWETTATPNTTRTRSRLSSR